MSSCAASGMVKCHRCYHWSYSMLAGGLCNICAVILEKQYPQLECTRMIRDELALRGLSPQDNPMWEQF